MIKFFRHIRQRLLSESKFSKYLIYAFGEIILVVIGILIALQINNWNEDRKDRKLEHSYVNLLTQDLRADADLLDELVEISTDAVDSKNILLDYMNGMADMPDSLSLHFTRAIFGSIRNFVPNKGAIEEVQNAGGLSLIKNEPLRNQILKLYNAYDNLDKNIGENYLVNKEKMRDLVYDRSDEDLFITHEDFDQKSLEHILANPEVMSRLINNYAISYQMEIENLSNINTKTIRLCNEYLKQLNG